jgi:hypothetical protein
MERVSGARRQAQVVAAVRDQLEHQTGHKPFIIATDYATAGLMAFYLPDHPSVCCVSALRAGGRKSAYDYFADTDLSDPGRWGRPVVLLGWGGSVAWWGEHLGVAVAPAAQQDANKTIFTVAAYAGLRERQPAPPGGRASGIQ